MRVELIEQLRCPAAHEASPLVTIAHSRDGDRILEGVLGCPVCGARFQLRSGVVHLGERARATKPDERAVDPMRLAALLNLSEPDVRVALGGFTAHDADDIEAATDVRVVAINSPDASKAHRADALTLGLASALPFADRALYALAVDDTHIDLLPDAARVVRVGGRVLAPVAATLPAGCVELARDAKEWVAEVQASVSAPVSLERAAVRVP